MEIYWIPVEFELMNSDGKRQYHAKSGFRIFGGWSEEWQKHSVDSEVATKMDNWYSFFNQRNLSTYNGGVAGGQDSNAGSV